jgi:hypothetical protein
MTIVVRTDEANNDISIDSSNGSSPNTYFTYE